MKLRVTPLSGLYSKILISSFLYRDHLCTWTILFDEDHMSYCVKSNMLMLSRRERCLKCGCGGGLSQPDHLALIAEAPATAKYRLASLRRSNVPPTPDRTAKFKLHHYRIRRVF